MVEELRRLCREALASKRLDAIYGLQEQAGARVPHFFVAAEKIDGLVLEGQHPLLFTCRPANQDIVALAQRRQPGLKLGIVARGCDERALFELAKRGQASLEGVEIIGVACDRAQAEACRCGRPYPQNLRLGEKVEGISEDQLVAKFLSLGREDRLSFWEYQLGKCLKCYGCRNACPVCSCEECRMEQASFSSRGSVPPEFPLFHFVQVMHHADRCVDCGECEHACPVDIPLRLLKKIMRAEVVNLFGYEPGLDAAQPTPFARLERGGTSHEA